MKKSNLLFGLIVSSFLFFILFENKIVSSQQPVSDEYTEYTVVRGDTLSGIAKKYSVTVKDLYEANRLTSDVILIGQKLKIPSKTALPSYEEPPVKPEKPTVTIEKPAIPEEKPAISIEKEPIPEEKPAVTIEKPPVSPDALAFKWAFVARIDPDGRNKVVNIAKNDLDNTKIPSVSAGDKIALYIEPLEHTYIYIYLLDAGNNLELIFPTSMDSEVLQNEFSPGVGTYIPGKYEWFSFDENKGSETFYLVASPKRLEKLEELTRNYVNADEDQAFAKQEILDEIKGKKRLVAFKTRLERPIAFGGRIRGLEIDIAKLAVEVEADHFYSKTIRIRNE